MMKSTTGGVICTRKNLFMRVRYFAILSTVTATLILVGMIPKAHAQNKVDLEDMTIKGELVNDDRLRMSSRESQTMKEKIGYRANFRKEIVDFKEVEWPSGEVASSPALPDSFTAPIAAPLAPPPAPLSEPAAPEAAPAISPLAKRTAPPTNGRAPASVQPAKTMVHGSGSASRKKPASQSPKKLSGHP